MLFERVNFIYIQDISRGLELALPVWNPGNNAPAFFRSSNTSWLQWREFNYSSCVQDNIKPTVGENPDFPEVYDFYRREGGIDFRGINSRLCYGRDPANLFDYTSSIRFYLNITDNRDQDLIFRQEPPSGTPVPGNEIVEGQVYIMDNSGNEIVIPFLDFIGICD